MYSAMIAGGKKLPAPMQKEYDKCLTEYDKLDFNSDRIETAIAMYNEEYPNEAIEVKKGLTFTIDTDLNVTLKGGTRGEGRSTSEVNGGFNAEMYKCTALLSSLETKGEETYEDVIEYGNSFKGLMDSVMNQLRKVDRTKYPTASPKFFEVVYTTDEKTGKQSKVSLNDRKTLHECQKAGFIKDFVMVDLNGNTEEVPTV